MGSRPLAAPAEAAQGGTTEASASPEAGGADEAVVVQVGTTGGRFDLRQARRSFEVMRGEFVSIAPAELLTVRIDLQKVALVVLSLLWRDSTPERRAVFERFAAQGNYDVTLYERLPVLALAAWYVRRQQQRAVFAASGAT